MLPCVCRSLSTAPELQYRNIQFADLLQYLIGLFTMRTLDPSYVNSLDLLTMGHGNIQVNIRVMLAVITEQDEALFRVHPEDILNLHPLMIMAAVTGTYKVHQAVFDILELQHTFG